MRFAYAWLLCAAWGCRPDIGYVGAAAEVAPPQAMPPDAGRGSTATGCPEPCAGETRCHPALQTCVECVLDADCLEPDAPMCDEEDFECVGCLSDQDCPGEEPFCNDDRCAECAQDLDCDPLETCEDGQCELEAEGENSGESP